MRKEKIGIPRVIAINNHKIRVILVFSSLIIFLSAFLLGSLSDLTPDKAQAMIKQFEQIIGTNPSASTIIQNNLILCFQFFIPILGTFFLAQVGYNTGVFLAALSLTYQNQPNVLTLFLLTLTFPWAWMEFAAYSLSSAQGIMFAIGILSRQTKREAKNLLIAIIVSVALVVLGGIIESIFINAA